MSKVYKKAIHKKHSWSITKLKGTLFNYMTGK